LRTEKAPQVQVHAATFVAETRTLASLPPVGPPEIAISGRSNVGKSTLLNRLAGRHKLARTSKTPGRTRGMVFYDLRIGGGAPAPVTPRELRLCDLPGFGYAQVSHEERASWQPLIEGYVERRPTLALFVVLVDARRGIAAEEAQLIEWLATLLVPVQVVYTKIDKLSASERGTLRASVRTRGDGAPGGAKGVPAPPADGRAAVGVAAAAPSLRPPFVSGETGDGVDELWGVILRSLPGATEIAAVHAPA
jgi:GTP-binding protein